MDHFENYDESQKRAFMLGTLFPDIRYMANIPREKTHSRGVTIEELINTENPFIKGVKLLSFVDENRASFLRKHSIFNMLKNFPEDSHLSLKLLEDEILYSMRKESASLYICEFLQHIEKEELSYNASIETIKKWHEHIREILSQKPSDLYDDLIISGRNHGKITNKSIKNAYKIMQSYSKDERFIEYVIAITSDFNIMFLAYKENLHLN